MCGGPKKGASPPRTSGLGPPYLLSPRQAPRPPPTSTPSFPPTSQTPSFHPSPVLATGSGLIQLRQAQPSPRQGPARHQGPDCGPRSSLFFLSFGPSSLLTCEARDQNSPTLTRPKSNQGQGLLSWPERLVAPEPFPKQQEMWGWVSYTPHPHPAHCTYSIQQHTADTIPPRATHTPPTAHTRTLQRSTCPCFATPQLCAPSLPAL